MKDDVLKAIQGGQVKMRPKWQFITKAALMLLGVVLVALTTLYLVSFIVFILRQTGVLFVPAFGPGAFGVFFMSLPWLLIALAAIFMLLLEILIKRYSFAYGRPFLYSALAVIFLGIAGGIIIGETPLHERFFDAAENGQLPFAGPVYEYYRQQPARRYSGGNYQNKRQRISGTRRRRRRFIFRCRGSANPNPVAEQFKSGGYHFNFRPQAGKYHCGPRHPKTLRPPASAPTSCCTGFSLIKKSKFVNQL